MARTIGIVVAGLGRAGRARVRDLTEKDFGNTKLVGVVSRRRPEDVSVPFLSWDEALGNSEVDAVIIATENGTHAEYIRKTLNAGKHVLVEFPLAISFKEGKDLLNLADEKGLILQEEDIGLHLPQQKELRETLKSKPRVTKAKMTFSATFSNQWIGDLTRAGFPSFSGLSRIHIVYTLFGEVTVSKASLLREENRICMTATLLTKDKRPIEWTEDRGEGFQRSFGMDFELEDGSKFHYPPSTPSPSHGAPSGPSPHGEGGDAKSGPPKGLFAADLLLFLSKLRGEVKEEEMAEEKARVLHCLEVAGEIERLATL